MIRPPKTKSWRCNALAATEAIATIVTQVAIAGANGDRATVIATWPV